MLDWSWTLALTPCVKWALITIVKSLFVCPQDLRYFAIDTTQKKRNKQRCVTQLVRYKIVLLEPLDIAIFFREMNVSTWVWQPNECDAWTPIQISKMNHLTTFVKLYKTQLPCVSTYFKSPKSSLLQIQELQIPQV